MKKLELIPLSGELPSPKGVALAILELCRRDDTTLAEIARVVQTDPALSSRLIRQANSAAQGAVRPIASVVDAIGRVTVVMSEIRASSAEQSTGIDQVGQAVREIDQSTQQNAALAEQTSAAAEHLKGQGQALVDAVAFFRT